MHFQLAVEFDERKVDAIFSGLDQHRLPGAAVGIALGGRPLYRKGFGLANMELPVILTPATRMRIASTTKHFTALAYLLLCEEGRASLDDRIVKYLPELHPVAHEVTMRQLMGHVSGLRDSKDLALQFSGVGRRISSGDLLALYRGIDDVNFVPGTGWCYNNGGYLMLTVAIERITGQSLENVLSERIFERVGMYDTRVRRSDTDFVPNSATLHMISPAGGYEKSYLGVESAGEGGIVSTVDDMLRWLAHMESPKIGNEATWQAIKTPQILANGASTGYGLGLMIGRHRGARTLSHAGGVMGGSAQMLKVPAAGLDVVILVNRHDVNGAQLVNEVLEVCLPDLQAAKPEYVRPLATGTFYSPATSRAVELCAQNGRQTASIDGLEIPLEPDNDGVLWAAGTAAYLQLAVKLRGDPQRPDAILLSDFGNCEELLRAKPSNRPETIAGRYVSQSTGTEATIYDAGDDVRMRTVGRYGCAHFHLERLDCGAWRSRSMNPTIPLGGTLSFDSDGGMFRFTSSRTRALAFRRAT